MAALISQRNTHTSIGKKGIYKYANTYKFSIIHVREWDSQLVLLGKPSREKSEVFLNIVQKAFDPLPLLFEHLSYFAGGVF